MRYFISLAYNGTPFHGWQRQPNATSVQETLENALSTLLRQPITIMGAGRTDTGVHAKQMVAHFDVDLDPKTEANLVHMLNRYLDENIVIYSIRAVKEGIHARFDAIQRTYEYHITFQKNPFKQNTHLILHTSLDIDLMNEAANLLLEHNNFEAFSKTHTDVKTFLCDISYAHWVAREDGAIFTITANRFLRNMVRAIVGTLLDVGTKKITVEKVNRIIASKDRGQAGFSVPACGLYLTQISYPEKVYK